MKSEEIRQQFLDFFKGKGHTIVPSAPMVIKSQILSCCGFSEMLAGFG